MLDIRKLKYLTIKPSEFNRVLSQSKRDYSVLLYRGRNQRERPYKQAHNYIRYWQAEGESRKTSQRVSDAITQAVLQGRFRGGNIAYGYKMVNNGHNNYKGRPVLDVTVDEESEAPILRLMFKLARERNYGYRRIARYLNENNYPTRTGVLWRASQIRQILNNPCYKGYYQLNYKNGVRENPKLIPPPFMPELVIISEEEWNATHEELRKHTTKSKGGKKSNHGSMLLAGLKFITRVVQAIGVRLL